MKHNLTKRQLIIAAVCTAALLGGGGIAAAATTAGQAGAPPATYSSSAPAPTPSGSDSEDTPPAYHSSVTTQATDSGSEAAQALALSKLATITLPDAAKAAGAAVPGGTVIEIELDNEAGNVVYTADVVTSDGESEVVVDAGNGDILANNPVTDHDD